MKNVIKFIGVIFLLSISNLNGQILLPGAEKIKEVYLTTYWGNVNVEGSSAKTFELVASYTDTSKKPKVLQNLSDYVTVNVVDRKLYLTASEPAGFESIDLELRLPSTVFVNIQLFKGGEVFARNLKNGVEVNSLNGSVRLESLGKYAMVSAANGEVYASFDQIDADLPVSLVTNNGGVSVKLPNTTKRNVRIISRKNGYVETNTDLVTNKAIANLNLRQYSKEPILHSGKINGGGALLFLSTENGPISINN